MIAFYLALLVRDRLSHTRHLAAHRRGCSRRLNHWLVDLGLIALGEAMRLWEIPARWVSWRQALFSGRPAKRVGEKKTVVSLVFITLYFYVIRLNMVRTLGQRDHKEVAARFLVNRSSLLHDDELFLGQHHLVPVKHGLGCLELNALEWRRI
jgi:hypothetical protein